MQIIDNKSSMNKASYSGTCTIAEFDNFTGIRKVSVDLLTQMDITLTDQAKQELSGASSARYVSAQKSGTVVQALAYYIQSVDTDPSLAEAASRLNVLTANVTSGNIGANVRNDLQWRD